MSKIIFSGLCASLFFLLNSVAVGELPFIRLGPADQLALDQPRVGVELRDPETGRLIGPRFANTFLLDTGANSILATDDAVAELNAGGYRTEGTFFEQGVAGFTEFDVSAPYTFGFADSNNVTHSLENARILSSNTVSFCPIPGLCSFFGIVGMPAMDKRVTTMDLSSIGGGDGLGNDIFEDIFDVDFMKTTFSESVPPANGRRYSVPVTTVHFPPEGDGPLPVWADIPFLVLDAVHGGSRQSGHFVLDTGAQLSLLSSAMAFDLGLDANGNGRLDDEAVGTQPIGGVGGQIDAPLLEVDELRLPTEQGIEMVFTDLTFAIVDIDPTIDGIFGMNFLASGWLGSVFSDLAGLGELLNDAGLGDLLEDFGLGDLGGLNGEGAQFGYFEKVHFDFREMGSGNGRVLLDLTDDVAGITAPDGSHGDLDNDADVDFDDRRIWVKDVNQTFFGDADLNGRFDSKDLVKVFQAGQYEDGLMKNSSWATGDFNGDWEFDTKDLVVAFQDGGYESVVAAEGVPEPHSLVLLLLGTLAVFAKKRGTEKA